jgi:peptidoglycan/LPS O-acetylase OafA/YrhL
LNFRYDINGLRALAVFGVVIFHFNNAWLPGGFVGVDVFFVISGYLMTKIIATKLQTGRFSVLNFYWSRARRIVPALLLLCLTLLVFGWFFLLNTEYQQLAKHVQDSLLFYSNHTYWLESGYFDASSHEKWLLHTWSLSVEWQFYLVYPVGLVIVAKILPLSALKWLILVATLAGFAGCVYTAYLWPDAAYFLLPTRAWQMLAGALVFFFPLSFLRDKSWVSHCGLALIIACYFMIDQTVVWPGVVAAIPIVAAMLVLFSGHQKSQLITNPIIQKVGLWSYSIYLWHWPVVVLINNFIDHITTMVLVIGMLSSVVLGWLSYILIEQSKAVPVKISGYAVTLSLAYFIFIYQGAITPLRPYSQSPINDIVAQYKNYSQTTTLDIDYGAGCAVSTYRGKYGEFGVEDYCVGDKDSGGVFLWGDSHMGALAVGLRAHLPESITISQITSSGCPSSFTQRQGDISRLRRACDFANELARSAINSVRPRIVIIANKDKHELMAWDETFSILYATGVEQVIVMGPVPQWYPSLPLVYFKSHRDEVYFASQKLDKNVILTNQKMLALSQQWQQGEYIDVLNNLCDWRDPVYHCRVRFDGELIAWDYGHLTVEGSKHIAEHIVIPKLSIQPQ